MSEKEAVIDKECDRDSQWHAHKQKMSSGLGNIDEENEISLH